MFDSRFFNSENSRSKLGFGELQVILETDDFIDIFLLDISSGLMVLTHIMIA